MSAPKDPTPTSELGNAELISNSDHWAQEALKDPARSSALVMELEAIRLALLVLARKV